jgi:hypothetical protein
MTDDEFVAALRQGTVVSFHHRDHLRLVWAILKQDHGLDVVAEISSIIRAFASAHDRSRLFHQTITTFWVDAMRHAVSCRPKIQGFEELLDVAPHLLDEKLPWKHWSAECLSNDAARHGWVGPDLVALPWTV